MRWFALLIALSSCVDSGTSSCPGRVCPSGLVCSPKGDTCVEPGAVAACVGKSDGASCAYGFCRTGLCLPIVCGNGYVEPGEQCDDGNQVAGDGCRPNCTIEFCGDGIIDPGEECDCGPDESNVAPPCTVPNSTRLDATCNPDCKNVGCGDGIVRPPEQCEPGVAITSASCLDFGFYDPDGLGCNEFCRFDTSACTESCGDGTLNGNEICDGSPPAGSCVAYAFDFGTAGCGKNTCTPTFDGCDYFGFHGVGAYGFFNAVSGAYAVTATGSIFHGESSFVWKDVYDSSHYFAAVWSSGDTTYVGGDVLVSLTPGGWREIDTITNVVAISGTGPDDVWVATGGGIVDRWDGTSWTALDSGLTDISTLWEVSPGDVMVGGAGLSRWNGTAFTAETLPAPLRVLSVWGDLASDRWAAGQAGVVLHDDGTGWKVSDTPTEASLGAIVGTGPDDVFVATASNIFTASATIYRWDGRHWSTVAITPPVRGLGVGDHHAILAASSQILRFSGSALVEPGDSDIELLGVGTVGKELFAVGQAGTALHYDGAMWLSTSTGSHEDLYDVWGDATDDVFAVGQDDTVLHWDGASWTRMGTPSSVQTLRQLVGFGPRDVYAVGDASLLHWDGALWSTVYTAPQLVGVWGMSDQDLYLLTPSDVEHWDGTSWKLMNAPIPSTCFGGGTITGSSDSDVVVAGLDYVIRWNGASWSTLPAPPHFYNRVAEWGADLFFAWSGNSVEHWDGASFSELSSATNVNALAVDPRGLELVGGPLTIQRTINGLSIDPIVGPLTTLARYDSIWVHGPDDVWIGTGSFERQTAVFYHHDGYVWSTVDVPVTAATRAYGTGDTLFVSDSATIWRYDGSWTDLQGTAGGGPIWASGPDDLYTITSDLNHWDGVTWEEPVALAGSYDAIRDVWGSAADDVYVVGADLLSGPFVEHWDGSSWQPVATPLTAIASAVFGTGPDDVYIGSTRGEIAHWNGARWNLTRTDVSDGIITFAGSARDDLFAGTDQNGLIHYDGTLWSPVRLPAGTQLSVLGMDGLSLWIVGHGSSAGGTVVHLVRDQSW
jgi:cysteine-rich repeat protein